MRAHLRGYPAVFDMYARPLLNAAHFGHIRPFFDDQTIFEQLVP